MRQNLFIKIMLICFISFSFSFCLEDGIAKITSKYTIELLPKKDSQKFPKKKWIHILAQDTVYLKDSLHLLPEFKSNPNDSNYFPPFLRPMYFNVYDKKSDKNYKVEGYVADLLTLIKKDTTLLPKKYDYFVKLFNDNIVKIIEFKYLVFYHSSMIYTIDPINNICPEFWKLVKIGKNFKKCVQTTMLPIYYIKESYFIKGTSHTDIGSFWAFKRDPDSLFNVIKNESGCKAGNPKISNVLNDSDIFCFGVGKGKHFFSGIPKYYVKKGRFKEGNYLYYHSAPRKGDDDYREPGEHPDECQNGWLTKLIPEIFMIDGEYKIDCYYKIPDPKF